MLKVISLLSLLMVMVYCQTQSAPQDNDGCNICKNGGQLTVSGNNITCSCPPEYSGAFCEKVNPICQNGGAEEDMSNGCKVCHCTDKFYGERCEKSCPSGFTLFKNSTSQPVACFSISKKQLNWNDASANCGQLAAKGALAVLDTPERNAAAKGLIKADPSGCGSAWTAGQRQIVNNCTSSFYWKPSNAAAKPVVFTDWEPTDPNCGATGSERESCISLYINWQWNDAQCSATYCSVCEAPL
jgi:hypothetical protein